MSKILGLFVCVFLIFLSLPEKSLFARQGDVAGRFSYYALVLSWSPTYCASRSQRTKEPQCQDGRPYAFVLHGLWPQHRVGWPEYCPVRDKWIPRKVIDSMMDIMPSRRLVIHEWKKHGVCSGLDPQGYYAVARELFQRIKIPARYLSPNEAIVISPEKIESDFLKTNPELNEEMISVVCGRRKRLRELRFCFDRRLQPAPCGVNERQRRLCRLKKVVMPPVRGGIGRERR